MTITNTTTTDLTIKPTVKTLFFKTSNQDAIAIFKRYLNQLKKHESESKLHLSIKSLKSSVHPHVSIYALNIPQQQQQDHSTRTPSYSSSSSYMDSNNMNSSGNIMKYVAFKDHKSMKRQESIVYMETSPLFDLILRKTTGLLGHAQNYTMEGWQFEFNDLFLRAAQFKVGYDQRGILIQASFHSKDFESSLNQILKYCLATQTPTFQEESNTNTNDLDVELLKFIKKYL